MKDSARKAMFAKKNITYNIEKYNSLDNRWVSSYNMENYSNALEFYNNNNDSFNSMITDESKKNGNFSVYRIVEVKTTSKPVLTNNELLKVAKNNIKRLRKQGRIR